MIRLALLVPAAALSSVAQAETLTVGDGAPSSFATVQSAVDAAQDGDVIEIFPGEYDAVTVDGDRVLSLVGVGGAHEIVLAGLTVHGAETELTARSLTVSHGARAVTVNGGLLLAESFRVVDAGDPVDGYGIAVIGNGALRGERIAVERVSSPRGALVLEPGAQASLQSAYFTENTGEQSGAIWMEGAQLDVQQAWMGANAALRQGGAITAMGGSVTLVDAIFEENLADDGGALYFGAGAAVEVRDSTFSKNVARRGGHITLANGALDMLRASLIGGEALRGGALYVGAGTADLQNLAITGSEGVADGGAIYQAGGAVQLAYSVAYGNGGAAAYTATAGEAAVRSSLFVANSGASFRADGAAVIDVDRSLLYGVGAVEVMPASIRATQRVLSADPRFVDPLRGDFTLGGRSPAIDAGAADEYDPDHTLADIGLFGGPLAEALADADHDGFVVGRDCDDADASRNESAADAWYDGVDGNCDGANDFDQDGDGHAAVEFGGRDCVDTDETISPDMAEQDGDGIDSDCDGTLAIDADRDGWPATLDCDDANADVSPTGDEVWYDGVDSDCDGWSDFDADRDGYTAVQHGGADCDDTNVEIGPEREDVIGDGIDQDCSGADAQASSTEEGAENEEEIEGIVAEAPVAAVEADKGGCSTAGSAPMGLFAGLLAGLSLFFRRQGR